MYNIPSVLGKTLEGNKKAAPAFSISGRQKEPQDERALVPGPGAYEPSVADCYNNHLRSPAYSISSRYNIPSDATLKPGPGAHCPEKVKQAQSPAPPCQYSMPRALNMTTEYRQRQDFCSDDITWILF